jgi:hypothetical protein
LTAQISAQTERLRAQQQAVAERLRAQQQAAQDPPPPPPIAISRVASPTGEPPRLPGESYDEYLIRLRQED